MIKFLKLFYFVEPIITSLIGFYKLLSSNLKMVQNKSKTNAKIETVSITTYLFKGTRDISKVTQDINLKQTCFSFPHAQAKYKATLKRQDKRTTRVSGKNQ